MKKDLFFGVKSCDEDEEPRSARHLQARLKRRPDRA